VRNIVDLMNCLLEEKNRRNREERSVDYLEIEKKEVLITFESTKIPQIKNHFL